MRLSCLYQETCLTIYSTADCLQKHANVVNVAEVESSAAANLPPILTALAEEVFSDCQRKFTHHLTLNVAVTFVS